MYQKLERADFTFWYDKENGEKKRMLDEMTNPESGIMENPIIQEEKDLVHFIIKCKSLEKKRDYNLIHKETVEQEERMRELLYRSKDYTGVGKMIKNL